jgi:hypothetical protein
MILHVIDVWLLVMANETVEMVGVSDKSKQSVDMPKQSHFGRCNASN